MNNSIETTDRLPWRRTLPVVAMTAACFALTLRIFYPGVMTYDAGIIHSYIAAGRAGDWQSPLMTTVWAVIDPIAPGAGSIRGLHQAMAPRLESRIREEGLSNLRKAKPSRDC